MCQIKDSEIDYLDNPDVIIYQCLYKRAQSKEEIYRFKQSQREIEDVEMLLTLKKEEEFKNNKKVACRS